MTLQTGLFELAHGSVFEPMQFHLSSQHLVWGVNVDSNQEFRTRFGTKFKDKHCHEISI